MLLRQCDRKLEYKSSTLCIPKVAQKVATTDFTKMMLIKISKSHQIMTYFWTFLIPPSPDKLNRSCLNEKYFRRLKLIDQLVGSLIGLSSLTIYNAHLHKVTFYQVMYNSRVINYARTSVLHD